jgi:hypothetical protein
MLADKVTMTKELLFFLPIVKRFSVLRKRYSAQGPATNPEPKRRIFLKGLNMMI